MSSDGPVNLSGTAHSIEVPPPHDARPEDLRRAAAWLGQSTEDVDALTARLDALVTDLTQGAGQWRGPTADAFRAQAWAPIKRTLFSLARALEQASWSLTRAAAEIENAQTERRRAELIAVGAGVAVALTVLTFGISDAAAAEAAAGAAALMSRAAVAAASAMRTVVLALEDAAAAVRTLSVTMQSWGTGVAYAVSVTLPPLVSSPVGLGLVSAAGTAGLGDLKPEDLVAALALGYLEGASGDAVETPGPQGAKPSYESIPDEDDLTASTTETHEVEKANTARLERLGQDPATGGHRKSEMETAERVEGARGVTLERAKDPNVDWVDGDGKTYDAVGNFDARHFDQQWPNLQHRILDHLAKADYVPIDVSKFSAAQVQMIERFISNLGPRVFLVGK